jgi:O-antigen/teichoic acid export membrane protein
LFAFGGWLTVSNLVGPLMIYMDRFYLAAVRPVAEVAHYVAPYELATKIGLIPAGVLPVLFPLLVSRWIHRGAGGARLPAQLAAAMALGCAGPAAMLAVFGPELMQAWTGTQVPRSSASALQVLAGAVFVNCVAQVFMMQLQSMGRTDLIARLHVGEVAVYACLLWFLTGRYGVVGVALAWGLRVALDTVLLCGVATAPLARFERRLCWGILAATLAFGTLLGALAWVPSLALRAAGPLVALLILLAWRRPITSFLLGTASRPLESR